MPCSTTPVSTHAIIARRVLAPVMIVLALGMGRADAAVSLPGEIVGLSPTTHSGHRDADPHSRDCACATKCRGASCCCGKKAEAEPPSAPTDGPHPSNPCVRSTPCGDSNLPENRLSSVSVDKSAALGSFSATEPLKELGGLVSPDFLDIPASRACRLERPPDRRPSRSL